MPTFAANATQLLFQNTLAEVVRKLRASSRRNEAEAIDQYVKETKDEISSPVQSVKVAAIQKAVYFHMLGYSASYASFNIVEVMADTAFANKRIAYVAACTVFSEDTDVLPLMTALLKRDLGSSNQYEAGLALYCMASICTPHLARELVVDVVNLLQHPRTYVRKKAVLSLYKLFLQYPDALRPTYPKLKEKLEDSNEHSDPDPAVRGAVICVLCELARRNPANFLGLAVPFYSLLSSVHSNWTLIKIVKVFGYFAPLEPRLGKKLVEPLTNLITSTSAKSVQYECLLAVANGMSKVPALTKLAADKLRLFVSDADQNLKFLGLEAMSRLAVDNAKLLSDQRDVIMLCLDDADVTIRCKALALLRALVTRRDLVSTVNHILDHCLRGATQTTTTEDEVWLNAVVRTIIEMVRIADYALLEDFEWYVGVLVDVGVLDITNYAHGRLVEGELVTVLSRVNGVRQYGVGQLAELFSHERLMKQATTASSTASSQWRVVSAAAFACGEYPHWLPNKRQTCAQLVNETVTLLPVEAQLACMTALSKIVAYLHHPAARHVQLCDGEEEGGRPDDITITTLDTIRAILLPPPSPSPPSLRSRSGNDAEGVGHGELAGLELFRRSTVPDVQERACLVYAQLEKGTDERSDGEVAQLYEKELPPVAAGAQAALELPDSLDLDEPFCDDLDGLMGALTASDADENSDTQGDEDGGDEASRNFSVEYQIALQRRLEKERMAEVKPFYLKPTSVGADGGATTTATRNSNMTTSAEEGGEGGDEGGAVESTTPNIRRHRTHRSERAGKRFILKKNLQLPAAARLGGQTSPVSDPATAQAAVDEPEEDEATRKLRHIDVTRALTADEKLPETKTYAALLGGGGALATATAARTMRDGDEAALPVTLHESHTLRVVLYVDGCKMGKKDAVALRCALHVTNLMSSGALQNVRLGCTCGVTAGGTQRASVVLEEDKGDTVVEEAMKGEDGDGTLCIADAIRRSELQRKTFVLRLLEWPASVLQPLPLVLHYHKEHKRRHTALPFSLCYTYFSKHPTARLMTPDAFHHEILSAALHGAHSVMSFAACPRSSVAASVSLVQRRLRLVPVDIFRDAMSLYGILHGRRSSPTHAHVAVLLREAEQEGTKGVTIVARSHYAAIAQLLAHDIQSILQSSTTSSCPSSPRQYDT